MVVLLLLMEINYIYKYIKDITIFLHIKNLIKEYTKRINEKINFIYQGKKIEKFIHYKK
jgi:hypothetical protein